MKNSDCSLGTLKTLKLKSMNQSPHWNYVLEQTAKTLVLFQPMLKMTFPQWSIMLTRGSLGASSTANSNVQITYEFSQVGTRYMLLKGLSGNGEMVAQADAWITIEPEVSPGLLAVPYFYQYSNSLYPYSSCQNTSIAMLLAYFGWPGVPDDITAGWGKDYTQSPSGLADAFNTSRSQHV